ncbi:MAG: cupin domain-containing protein [Halofilum sp. (in: g-proteobacteria)]|nr:cupin domain-containing protein [Halofilum sp. (in: g-proteobacteria)]
MATTETTEATATSLGPRLRAVRARYGLSQRELARRAGVTHATISLIETERVSPSVSSLKKVLDGIPLSLAEFFTLDVGARRQVFYRAGELPDMASGDIRFALLGADRQDRAMTILHETYAPGADTGEEMLAHDGEEGGIVIRGEIELTVAGEARRLGAGDGYYFESRLPHRFRNPGDVPCEIVSANTPPSI